MSMPEQSGDSFDFCVLFRVYFIGKGAPVAIIKKVKAVPTNNKRVPYAV